MMLDLFAFESPPRPTGVRMRMEGMSIVKSGRLAGDVAFGPLTLELTIAADGKTARLSVAALDAASCKRIIVHLGGWASVDKTTVIELDPRQAQQRQISINPNQP